MALVVVRFQLGVRASSAAAPLLLDVSLPVLVLSPVVVLVVMMPFTPSGPSGGNAVAGCLKGDWLCADDDGRRNLGSGLGAPAPEITTRGPTTERLSEESLEP